MGLPIEEYWRYYNTWEIFFENKRYFLIIFLSQGNLICLTSLVEVFQDLQHELCFFLPEAFEIKAAVFTNPVIENTLLEGLE